MHLIWKQKGRCWVLIVNPHHAIRYTGGGGGETDRESVCVSHYMYGHVCVCMYVCVYVYVCACILKHIPLFVKA